MSWVALILAMVTGLLAFLAARYAAPLFNWPRWVRGGVFYFLPFWLYVASTLLMVMIEPQGAEDALGWAVFVAIFALWPIWFAWALGYILGYASRVRELPSAR